MKCTKIKSCLLVCFYHFINVAARKFKLTYVASFVADNICLWDNNA